MHQRANTNAVFAQAEHSLYSNTSKSIPSNNKVFLRYRHENGGEIRSRADRNSRKVTLSIYFRLADRDFAAADNSLAKSNPGDVCSDGNNED